MTVHDFLYGIRDDQREINSLCGKIEWKNENMMLQGSSYGVRVQASLHTDRMGDDVAEVEDWKNEAKELEDALAVKRKKAEEIISYLPDRKQRLLLRLYFLSDKCETFAQLSERTKVFNEYDWEQTCKDGVNKLEWIEELQSKPREQTIAALMEG